MRLTGLLMMSGLAIGALASDALAHGGSHATPWPTPTTSTYSYTPQTYFPTYTPTVPTPTSTVSTPGAPTPTSTTPTTPGPGTTNPTSNPSGPAGPTTGPGGGPTGPSRPTGPKPTSGPTGPVGPSSGPTGPSSTPQGPTGPQAPVSPGGTGGAPQAPTAPTPPGGGTTTAPTNPGNGPSGPTTGGGYGPHGPGVGSPTAPGNDPKPPVTGPTPPGGSTGAPTNPYGPTHTGPQAPGRGGKKSGPAGPSAPRGPGSRPSGAGPVAPGSTTKAQDDARQAENAKHWEQWWHFAQWRFVRGSRARTQLTGTDGQSADPAAELAKWLRETALKDRHFDPRSAAAIALGKLGDLQSVSALQKRLLDRNEKAFVRESAALALGMMQSTGSSPLLVDVLRSRGSSDRLRVHAAIGLGLMKDPSAVSALLRILKARANTQIHVAATIALGLIADDGATSALLSIARAPGLDQAVRGSAITALGKIGPRSKRKSEILARLKTMLLTARKKDVRRSVALVLYRFEHPTVYPALYKAVKLDKDDVTRGFAMISLAEASYAHGDSGDRAKARRLFAGMLQRGNSVEKGYAALALGLMGRADRDCAQILRTALRAKYDDSTTAAVCIALGLMQDIASRQALADVAGSRRQADLRGYACVALGLLGSSDPRITTFLTELVEHVNIPEVKAAAALALSKVGSTPAALKTLRKAIRDRNRYFKMSAIVALGYFRDFGTVADLQRVYTSETNSESRALTVVALGYIGERSDVPVLRELTVDFNHLGVYQRMPDVDMILRLF